jgi:hypothetical protein
MRRSVALLALAVLAAACGGRDRRAAEPRETAEADRVAGQTPPSRPLPDSTVFGDDRARQGDAPRAPEVRLLERLVDEYEALDVVQDDLSRPGSESVAKTHAWKGDRHEDATKRRLAALLITEFRERYQPRTPARAAATADSVSALPDREAERALDQLVLAQHRRVADAIAGATPSLTNQRVREELTALEQDLRKEIAKLSRR